MRKASPVLAIVPLLLVLLVTAPFEDVGYADTALYPNDRVDISGCVTAGSYSLCLEEYYSTPGAYRLVWDGFSGSIGCGLTVGAWYSTIDSCYNGGYGTHIDQSVPVASDGYAQMQSDSNFVLYSAAGTARWATNTNGGYTNPYLNLQTDGNMVVYYWTGIPLWSLF